MQKEDKMKKHLSVLSLFLLLSLLGSRLLAEAQAEEDNPWVKTLTPDGQYCTTFNIGDPVRVVAFSDKKPYDVLVYEPGPSEEELGPLRYSYTVQVGEEDFDKVLTDISDRLGWWAVKAGSASTRFATAWYEVIPGTPLGVVAALSACFASLGTKRLLRMRKDMR